METKALEFHVEAKSLSTRKIANEFRRPQTASCANRVFVDIDTQRDFMEPTGSLYVSGADTIHGVLGRLTQYALIRGIPILATACAHELDEPDPEPFPPHCLAGTSGQKRIEATECQTGLTVRPNGKLAWDFQDGRLPLHLTLEKQRYDVFSHPDADRIVREYARSNPVFVVYGVATDYCVRCAVLGLLERGCRVEVVTDAVRAVDPSSESQVFEEFVRQGATLINSEQACS